MKRFKDAPHGFAVRGDDMVASEKAQKEEAYVQSMAQLMVETMMVWLLSRSGSILVLRYPWVHERIGYIVKQMPG